MTTPISFVPFDQIKQSYLENGYFALKKFVPQPLLQELEKFMLSLFQAYALPGENINQTTIRLNKENPQLLYIINQTIGRSIEMDQIRVHCRQVLKQIYPDFLHIELAPSILFGIPGGERILYDWHQEIHYHSELENVVHLWIPILNNASMENGTLSVMKGSHLMGKLPYKMKQKLVPNSVTNLLIQNIDELQKTAPEQFAVAENGDLVGLHSYIVHRGNTNNSKENVRFIISLRIAAINKCPSSYDFSVKS